MRTPNTTKPNTTMLEVLRVDVELDEDGTTVRYHVNARASESDPTGQALHDATVDMFNDFLDRTTGSMSTTTTVLH